MNQPMELSNLKLDFGANDQGFTLLELLMATLITTMVLIIITPPLFLAVATRVQAQRVEQALQFAQQNLELVRWVMNQNPSADQLPATVMEDVRQGLPHILCPTVWWQWMVSVFSIGGSHYS
ncbi:MAG: type II secretion system GspH family protein [Cyanobacteria bacterium LVE1205-1]|jgi:prepilin-type N-terminal cleavage/methylation domain-containing protein